MGYLVSLLKIRLGEVCEDFKPCGYKLDNWFDLTPVGVESLQIRLEGPMVRCWKRIIRAHARCLVTVHGIIINVLLRRHSSTWPSALPTVRSQPGLVLPWGSVLLVMLLQARLNRRLRLRCLTRRRRRQRRQQRRQEVQPRRLPPPPDAGGTHATVNTVL